MENKIIKLHITQRTFRSGAVLAALIACATANADPNSSTPRTDSTTGDPSSRGDTTAATTIDRTTGTSRTSASNMSRTDLNFIKEAAKGGQMEVKLGQLASDQSQNAQVKSFGERLVKDHSKANEELVKLAQEKGVNLSSEEDRAGLAAEKDVKKFSNKTGTDFDKAYIKHMVADHKKDISKFEKEAAQSSDPDVKAFAQQTLPTLREHLRMAEDIARSLGVNTASYSTTADESAAGASATTSTERGSDQSVDHSTSVNVDTGASPSASVNTTTDRNASASAQTETKPKTKWFSTDKNDGKLWGIFPAPHHKNRDSSNMQNNNMDNAAGSAPSTSSGSSQSNP